MASLGAWTWPGTASDGQDVAHVLLAHPPSRTDHDTSETVEARMQMDAVLAADRLLFGVVRTT
ncbi:hypothetical protein [Streptomyces sparsogenes]|uniref:Uncharacterized protein n=1 Tax=Streptomyces sparsogenes DSM 40356 TaxID=1331668 RepID=A0A1R1S612_9ACTN|nr:hypothetical protein [Streptomyces sparsogenes]OMI33700.1 hypothetical protein SPAR_40097 [Streptomyces sparsogenes DSM 40356]